MLSLLRLTELEIVIFTRHMKSILRNLLEKSELILPSWYRYKMDICGSNKKTKENKEKENKDKKKLTWKNLRNLVQKMSPL